MQKNSGRRSSLKLNLPRQKSADNDHQSLTRCKSNQDPNDTLLRRVQSFNTPGKSHRRLKVLHRAKGKMMIKITLSSPDASPEKTPPELFSSVDIDVEGANKKSCTPRMFSQEKSYKMFFDNFGNKGKHIDADVIVKENEMVVERFPVNELLMQKEKHIGCNNMNIVASPPEWNFQDLRTFGNKDFSLCERETHFLQTRKLYIQTAIKNLLNEEITDVNDVPQIALMGSGGGYRAMVAMSGIVNAMYDEKLLDCIMYTAALSGSSWYTATLYSHPLWPNINPRDVQEKLKQDISTNPKNISNVLHYGFDFFSKKWSGEDWSFTTDVFGPMLGNVLIPDRLESRWSDQADKLTEGTVPLPLLAAIHAKEEENTDSFHEWVEFSPFEVSISKYGAAINMKHFGSEFKKGVLTKQNEEPALYQIMGICGSAFTITHQELLNKDAGQSKQDQPKNKNLGIKENQTSSTHDKSVKSSHPLYTHQDNREGYDELDGMFTMNQQAESKTNDELGNQLVRTVLCPPVNENEEQIDQLDAMSGMASQKTVNESEEQFDQLDGMSILASQKIVNGIEEQFYQLDGKSNIESQKTVNGNDEKFDHLGGLPSMASQNTVNGNDEKFDQLDGMFNFTSQKTVNGNGEEFDQLDGMSSIALQKTVNGNEEPFDQLDIMPSVASQKKVNGKGEKFDQLVGMSNMVLQNTSEAQHDQNDGESNVVLQKTREENEAQHDQIDGNSSFAEHSLGNENEEQCDQIDGMSDMIQQHTGMENQEQCDQFDKMQGNVPEKDNARDRFCISVPEFTKEETREIYNRHNSEKNEGQLQAVLTKRANNKNIHIEHGFDILDCVPENVIDQPESDVFDGGCIDYVQSPMNTPKHVSKQSNIDLEPSEDILNDLENSFTTICNIIGKDIHHCENLTDEVKAVCTNSTHVSKSNIETSCSPEEVADEVDGTTGENIKLIVQCKQIENGEGTDVLDGLGYFIPESVKQAARKMAMKSRRTRAAMINNFMRKVSFDEPDGFFPTTVKSSLFENYMKKDLEKLCLIDAGIAFNSPYPLLFQPGRDTDLILSFDFTDRHKDANDPFKTLLKTESWARTHEIKFPNIADNVDKFNEREVQELYIFEDETDEECPIIMHFVLVNNEFREYIKPGIKRKEEDLEFANFNIYDDQSTFHCMNFQYSEENFDRLSKLSEFIVLNNMEKIKTCIGKSIKNKRKRSTRNRQRHPSAPL